MIGRIYNIKDTKIRCRFSVRLLIYFILLIFTGPYFGNWTTTEKFLCRINVYASECSLAERIGPSSDNFKCSAQRFMIAKLGSIIRLSVLTVGFPLGLLLDNLGPKITFLIGIAMRVASWVIFSIEGVNNVLVIISGILLGLSRNAIAYPTLTIYMYTTSFKEFATTIMGIGITLAGLYIVVLERLMGLIDPNPYRFTLISALVTHIPCLMIGLAIFPLKPPPTKTQKSTTGRKRSVDSFCSSKSGESSRRDDEDIEIVTDAGDIHHEIVMDEKDWNSKMFLRYITSTEYLITCPYFVLNFLDFFFVQLMFSTMYGQFGDVIVLNEYLMSFSFILTFLIGFSYKTVKPLTIVIVTNIFAIINHFISFGTSRIAGIFSSITLIIYGSVLFTQMNIYIQSTFNSKYFGSLIGTINTLSGFVLFLNILLISIVEKHNCINYIHVAMIVIRILFLGSLTFLNLMQKGRTKSI
ncbi:hypothetical protein BEWA_024830 [Theileria equi strain WA]|uniref:Major facilitator superfamily (MFS) profile domain-containing protein n=1 Tax=Theileria equi strain WA TaxID=1537102 RepID=L0AXJ9_THEEQ|nr:hypothetical protein BEWA_024830 [Theileria equi strain WA]AFZ79634.1 hypothetical protein BEWA_024830 [Theileria equi strain WA]|eukprot:XP_004829300.1 hypothetical protein BEWA_024830 [Theileria equi strain WA]